MFHSSGEDYQLDLIARTNPGGTELKEEPEMSKTEELLLKDIASLERRIAELEQPKEVYPAHKSQPLPALECDSRGMVLKSLAVMGVYIALVFWSNSRRKP
jgi:hypothetical protein